MNWYKKAQLNTNYLQETEVQTQSPNIVIYPYEPLIQEAVDELKSENPNIFVGINKIFLDNKQSALGYVSNIDQTENRYDYNNIHINIDEIKRQVQQNISIPIDINNEEHKRIIINAIKQTIIHERAHVMDVDFNEETGEVSFPGGESVAENQTRDYLGF